ncbi:MAG: ABC transporter permease [Candidatus Kariarchaeaceae archaeon]
MATEQSFGSTIRSRSKDTKEASSSLRIIGQIAFKQIRIILQYKLDVIYWVFMPLLWLIPFVWLGKTLIDNGESANFLKYTGSSDYLGFLLIGSMLWATIDSAIWGAGNALRWEQQSGTLEYLWVSPASRTDILSGAALGETGWVFFNVMGQFIILSFIFDWNLTLFNSLFSLAAVIVMFIGMLGFGFFFASIVMVFKEPGVLTELTDNILFIVSPVRYPIQGLPVILRYIAVALPFTWGAKIIRDLLIVQRGVTDVLLAFLILILIDIGLWIIGYRLFHKVERRTRRTGNLGTF